MFVKEKKGKRENKIKKKMRETQNKMKMRMGMKWILIKFCLSIFIKIENGNGIEGKNKPEKRALEAISSWHSAFISSYSHRSSSSSSFLCNADIFSSCKKALRLIRNVNCIEF